MNVDAGASVGLPELGSHRVADVAATSGERVSERTWTRLVYAATAGAAGLMAYVAILAHHRFQTGRFDTGNVVQVVSNTAHGRFFEITDVLGIQRSRLAFHVEPVIVALAGLWRIWPAPEMLLLVQALALAAGALPVFWLARAASGSARAGMLMAVAYLLSPTVHGIAMDDLHVDAFAVPLALFAIWFAYSRNTLGFCTTALALTLCKEQMGLLTFGLGLWFAYLTGRRMVGAAVAVAGLGWTLVSLEVIVPHYYGSSSVFYSYYTSIGGSPLGIAGTAVQHPVRLLQTVTEWRDVLYAVELILPVVALCLLSPALLAVGAPLFAQNVLSSTHWATDVTNHHAAPLVPIVFGAAALGLSRIRHVNTFLLASVAVSIVALALYGPYAKLSPLPPFSKAHLAALRHAAQIVPASAPVAATQTVGGHLSARRHVEVFPLVRSATWVVVDDQDPYIPIRSDRLDPERQLGGLPTQLHKAIAEFRASPRWRVVYDCQGVTVFTRRRTADSNRASTRSCPPSNDRV